MLPSSLIYIKNFPISDIMAQKCSMFKMHGIFSAHSFSFSICVLTTAVTLPAVGMKNLSMSKTVTSSF